MCICFRSVIGVFNTYKLNNSSMQKNRWAHIPLRKLTKTLARIHAYNYQRTAIWFVYETLAINARPLLTVMSVRQGQGAVMNVTA